MKILLTLTVEGQSDTKFDFSMYGESLDETVPDFYRAGKKELIGGASALWDKYCKDRGITPAAPEVVKPE